MQEFLKGDTSREFDRFHQEVEEIKDIWDSYQKLFFSFKASEEEIQKKNDALKELNESKDKFFSIISHDLRSPFQGLLGISNYLVEEFDSLSKEEFKEMVVSLNEALHTQFKFLDDLLSWSRIQSGKMVFEPVQLNLYSEIEKTLRLFETNIKNKKIEVLTNINSNLQIKADCDMISLLLRNIISNAIKFTKQNGTIEITAFTEDEMVLVVISDSGVGIAEENIPKLFRIDVQFTTHGTAKESGNGLGLVLCKEIVEKHGGKIWVESRLNNGTQFFFTLPQKSELS
ncbi:MAG: Signal transduction histidine kinase [Ignavibacteria bacterium]|nr:MAG: Signal transduction histidine kinase [Ignavibacteria bacterium]KAF0160685.1 MAG: Signal transduction histidine kinase [Ignavibacteria bacterium]